MSKVTPFLMFKDQLGAAIDFYTSTFPDSKVTKVERAGKDGPVLSAEFVVGGQRFLGYNGGPSFSFSEGVSLFVECEDQREVDKYWNRILKAGGKEQACGWIKDPFGLSWQIIPRRLMELLDDKDPKKAKAVSDAMLKMIKIDVAGLERAYRSVRWLLRSIASSPDHVHSQSGALARGSAFIRLIDVHSPSSDTKP